MAESVAEGQGGGPAEVSPRGADSARMQPRPSAGRNARSLARRRCPISNTTFQLGIQVAPSHEPDIAKVCG